MDLLNFFISNAFAEEAAALPNQQGSSFSFMLMVAVFFIFIYFGVWRPQSKRAKEQQQLMSSLAKGDEVLTAGGLLARIVKLSDQYVVVAIANNVEIIIQKTAIVNVLPKGTLKAIE